MKEKKTSNNERNAVKFILIEKNIQSFTMIVKRLNCTAFLIVTFVVAAIYVVKIANVVNVDYDLIGNESADDYSSTTTTGQQQQRSSNDHYDNDEAIVETEWIGEKPVLDDQLIIDDKFDRLMWFMQITDLHISAFADRDRIDQLKEFCRNDVITIGPSVVLASGDLTDGRLPDTFGSRQLEEEWRIYKETVQESGVLSVTKWLDIRGNHDNFDVPSIKSSQNLFTKYSVQGSKHSRSYSYRVTTKNDSYLFVAMDACVEPGPRRPFNFVGLLTQSDMDLLSALTAKSQTTNVTSTIWFGHYPTSSILSPSPGIRHLMRRGHAYMCGHFHTTGGWIPKMYAMQKNGLLELELGDWRDSRLYRVAAVDHGLLSLIDVRHGSWPVVLVTNPKSAMFLQSDKEPSHRMLYSTHIRLLVFSNANVTEVMVSLDDMVLQPCHHVEGPLYVLLWKPNEYQNGIHKITVVARDSLGRETVISESFSLDGTRKAFDLLPRILLMSHLVTVAQIFLGLMLCCIVLPLCYVRVMHHYVRAGKLARPRYRNACGYAIMRKLWLVTSIDRIFYPVVVMTVYIPMGPLFVGHILNDHIGVCFAWGLFVNGSYLPGGFSFVFAFIHLVIFNIPLIFLLAVALDYRYGHLVDVPSCPRTPASLLRHLIRNVPFGIFFFVNAFLAFMIYPTYGAMAFFVNPMKTWSLIGAVALWLMATRLPASCFHSLLPIFPPNRRPPIIICQDVDKETDLRHGSGDN